jgi:glycosyltransferase involved in cell wall biosynthesis
MKPLLVVTDQWPHPPRNGVTLPVWHYIDQLSRHHDVRLCVLRPGDADEAADRAANEARFGPTTLVKLRRQGGLRRMVAELSGSEMFQHGWLPAQEVPSLPCERVLVSPISAVAKWRALRRAQPALRPGLMVAGVNDCTAAEYRWRSRSATGSLLQRAKARSDRLRVPFVAHVEAQLLVEYRRVLVQTRTDWQAMHDLVGATTAARCVVAPNGVRPDLFDITPATASQEVVFVAELSGEYGPLADWLCTEVWPRVRAACPEARLHIIGRGAAPALLQRMASTPGVHHLDFAPDLATRYAAAAVAWSPLFKGFGLINKTLEAMASALPVVGGLAAFNGIEGFQTGVHGYGVGRPDAAALATQTVQLLQDAPLRQQVGQAARELVRGRFAWQRSAELISEVLA